jgi:SAM-dependent methyltransferase
MALLGVPSKIMKGSFPSVWRFGKRLMGRYRISERQLRKSYIMNQIQPLEMALNRNGWSLQGFSSILDFGCGPGRLSEQLCWLVPNAELYGCDVDPMAVAEAQHSCPRGNFHANEGMPPLEFEDAKFDLVWCWGVFTNISENSQKAWLKELARVLRPGGVLLSTTHSYEHLKRMAIFSPDHIDKYKLPGTVDEFIDSECGFHYVSPPNWHPDYGWAVISKDYVTNNWPDYSGLSMVEYSEGAFETFPEGCQDIVLMSKKLNGTADTLIQP